MEPPSPLALWPGHLADLVARTRACAAPQAREELRGELWAALHAALIRFLRIHAHRGRASREDLEDLAAGKALELLYRAESGAWDLRGRSGDEIAGYVSTVAQHGLVDLARRAWREEALDDMEPGAPVPALDGPVPASRAAAPDVGVEARELASALRECFEQLDPRARRVWFFRAYYEMSSAQIASHPDVRIRAPHVDVVAQRARQSIRECMSGKGHVPGEAPAGAFVALWESLELIAAHPGVRREGGASAGTTASVPGEQRDPGPRRTKRSDR